jgi:hypothetical protein
MDLAYVVGLIAIPILIGIVVLLMVRKAKPNTGWPYLAGGLISTLFCSVVGINGNSLTAMAFCALFFYIGYLKAKASQATP